MGDHGSHALAPSDTSRWLDRLQYPRTDEHEDEFDSGEWLNDKLEIRVPVGFHVNSMHYRLKAFIETYTMKKHAISPYKREIKLNDWKKNEEIKKDENKKK